MKLIYRGTTFNYDSANISTNRSQHNKSPYELIYRGSTYQVNPTVATAASAKPMEYELIYRGSTYQVTRNEQGKVTAIASSTNSSKRKPSTNPTIQNATGKYSVEM